MIPALSASWLNLWLWPLPHFDYWRHWSEHTMRSTVLPHIPGI